MLLLMLLLYVDPEFGAFEKLTIMMLRLGLFMVNLSTVKFVV